MTQLCFELFLTALRRGQLVAVHFILELLNGASLLVKDVGGNVARLVL